MYGDYVEDLVSALKSPQFPERRLDYSDYLRFIGDWNEVAVEYMRDLDFHYLTIETSGQLDSRGLLEEFDQSLKERGLDGVPYFELVGRVMSHLQSNDPTYGVRSYEEMLDLYLGSLDVFGSSSSGRIDGDELACFYPFCCPLNT